MALLDDVKLRLRISHTSLDADITDNIEAAQADMIRAGVPLTTVQANGALVQQCIKTYCCAFYATDQSEAEKYMSSYQVQLDNLRKVAVDEDDGE